VTAGFPTADETVDILLGMEAGGAGKHCNPNWQFRLTFLADVIELGLPFTDPIADGPTIQKSNTVRTYSEGIPRV
jgi:tryptophan synthase